MGVKNLWEIIEPCKKTLPLHHLQNKRVSIDLSCWIIQLHKVNKSRISNQDNLYLRGLFHRLRALIALNCTILFVTDGSIPAIKLSTYRQRLNSGTEVNSDAANLHDKCSLRRNMGSQFSCMIKEAKILGSALGITSLDSIEEAEAQCALLNSESLCDGCFTIDSDAFLFGARTVYRDICLGEGGYVVCYEMTDIERELGFGRNSLIALALLMGSDYSPGVRGVGLESACRIIKSGGENNVLKHIVTEGLSFVKQTKASKKQTRLKPTDSEVIVNGTDKHSQKENQFVQVIDAYLKPKCHSADSELVHRVLAPLPFQRGKLQQVCAHFFGWMPEKTDEYILPKIAERDLRRFANLRLASSKLGVNPPLEKMPVTCPVSSIIKPRKLLGRDFFEVQWEGLEGLETSIVPADLVESACPEKITEFVEKRELGKKKKKKNPRKQIKEKSENIAGVTEVELRLQELLLDIESDSNTAFSYALPSKASTSEYTTSATVNDRELLLDIESDSNTAFTYSLPSKASASEDTTVVAVDDRKVSLDIESNSNTAFTYSLLSKASTSAVVVDYQKQEPHFCGSGPSLVKNEIIDLLSPSPMPRTRVVSRCQQGRDQCIDVIDLSDSEPEMSPEHAEKAREFRSFLARINIS
ncbi:Single-strand DNA endonuclease 1 [Euphorbia peplus]|nr:Single-strand DNA endonuclease 1 [Euphorbia peplus]